MAIVIQFMKQLPQLFIYSIFLFLILPVQALRASPPSTLNIVNYNYPGPQCSAYCMYEIKTDYNLNSLCTQSYSINNVVGNGYCKKCDPLLFRAVPGLSATTFYCIPHLYNSENATYSNSALSIYLGYFSDFSATTWVGSSAFIYSAIPPHYALRVRFGVYLHLYEKSQYIYPLQYSIDGTSFQYNQDLTEYWSPYDIITTAQLKHSDSQVTLTFNLQDHGWPVNTHASCSFDVANGQCYCLVTWTNNCGTTSTTCAATNDPCWNYNAIAANRACCALRYIQISDMIIFAAQCQVGCSNCTSSTNCIMCDISNATNRYYRYPVDNRCYTTCPQTSYKDNTTLFVNSTTYNQIEYLCTTCNNTCLECSSPTYCTKCFYAGRNQSFLYNNTCVNPCYNGYQGNYTTHVCVCPLDYFYEVIASLMCYPCAIQCVRCFGSTNLECTSCQKGFYLVNSTTHCLLACPDGQYISDITRTCLKCDPSCSSCKNEATLCTKCFISNTVKYLLGSECLTWCPAGYSWNNITYRCEECDFYTYSLNGKCVQFCPSMYEANVENKSCIHFSRTGYTFNLTLISVSILNHGKLLKLQILAQDGLNSTSYDAIMKRSYHNVQVVYKDSKLEAFKGVRNLVNSNLPIRNVQFINNKIYYYVQLPDNLDYRKSFQIVFLESIAGNQNINYNNFTNAYPVSQNPDLMKSYFLYTAKNNFNVILIALITIVLFLFSLQLKGVYELFMEFFRVIQLLGLLVYSAFPIGPYIFYYLIGCSYANLDFLPNLYAMTAKPETANNFSSYALIADDMDFIRLNGSVLLFAVVWTVVVLVSKYLFKVKENRLKYMVTFGIDIMEVKILHSFWSSLVFVLINYSSTNFSVFVTFAFAYVLFLSILARRYVIWKEQKDISPYFVWRLLATLLICFISLSNELLISLIFCLSVGATIWEFYLLHSSKYLIDINNLNSTNYMNEKTYKILNNYDEEVKYCWSISIRNTIIIMLPVITALFTAILILLKDSEYQVIIFTSALLYFFLIIIILNAIFIFNFLEERRKYLVQNKLEFLQKKYAKLSNNQTVIYEERRRPRMANSNNVFDEQKYLEQNPARSMMKNID